MASTLTRRVHKIDDLTLVQTFKEIAAAIGQPDINYRFDLAPGLSLSLDDLGEGDGLAGRYAFNVATLSATLGAQTNVSVHFYRSIQTSGNRTASAVYDEFDVNFGREPSNWQSYIELVQKIGSILGSVCLPIPQGEPADEGGTLRELMVGFGASHRQMLESLNSQLVELEKRRVANDELAAKREEEREHKRKEALAALNAEREKLQLQSYKAERRRILQEMTDDKAASLRKAMAPKGAIVSRWAVFATAVLLSLLAAALAYQGISRLGIEESVLAEIANRLPETADSDAVREAVRAALGPTNWFLIARTVISSLVAVGGLVYAATWLRTFYNTEAATARDIDRFNYDLVRASWIIETILEVKHEHAGDVPPEWIEGVTRGLFSGASSSTDKLDDGAQALKALLGFTASASFGPDGPRIDIGKKEARKLANSEADG